jgi:hypothetical protein
VLRLYLVSDAGRPLRRGTEGREHRARGERRALDARLPHRALRRRGMRVRERLARPTERASLQHPRAGSELPRSGTFGQLLDPGLRLRRGALGPCGGRARSGVGAGRRHLRRLLRERRCHQHRGERRRGLHADEPRARDAAPRHAPRCDHHQRRLRALRHRDRGGRGHAPSASDRLLRDRLRRRLVRGLASSLRLHTALRRPHLRRRRLRWPLRRVRGHGGLRR